MAVRRKPFRAGSALPNAAAVTAIGAGCAAVVGLGLLLRADRASLWTLSAPARESVSQLRAATKSRPACSRDATWLDDAPAGAKACRWPKVEGQGSDLVIWGDLACRCAGTGIGARVVGVARFQVGATHQHAALSAPSRGVGIGSQGRRQLRKLRHRGLGCDRQAQAEAGGGRWALGQLCLRRALARRRREAGRIVDATSGQVIGLAEALLRTLDRLAPHTPSTSCSSARCPSFSTMRQQRWCARCARLSELPPVWRHDFERRQRLVLAALADVAAAGRALVLYPHTVLCDGATCAVADGVRPLYSDDDHLSAFGAERVARALAPRLLKSLGRPVGASASP